MELEIVQLIRDSPELLMKLDRSASGLVILVSGVMTLKALFIGSKPLGLRILQVLKESSPNELQSCISFDDRSDLRTAYYEFERYAHSNRIELLIAPNPRCRMHEPLNQRIGLRYHMTGITCDEESREYVLHHLKLAGRSDPIFEDQAYPMLRQLGQGLPRKIGNIAVAAMTLAMTKRTQSISPEIVVKASDGI